MSDEIIYETTLLLMCYEVFVLQLLWYDFYVMAFLNGIVVLAMVAAATDADSGAAGMEVVGE